MDLTPSEVMSPTSSILTGRVPPSIDAVIPARNEAPTVASVVAAVRGSAYVRDVIVVDDGSTDATGRLAARAGARVVRRDATEGSKAHALEAGVESSTADAVLFVDADLLGLTSAHVDELCEPFVANRAVMSIGTFDYGRWNWFVLRFPPTTGQRVLPRWVFDAVPAHKRYGYTIEIFINEVITERRLPMAARVLGGVTHRTKRAKFGRVDGYRRTWRMFWELWALWGVCRKRTYWFYLRDVVID